MVAIQSSVRRAAVEPKDSLNASSPRTKLHNYYVSVGRNEEDTGEGKVLAIKCYPVIEHAQVNGSLSRLFQNGGHKHVRVTYHDGLLL